VVSPSAAFRYLSAFHDSEQEKARIKGKSFIPTGNTAQQGLKAVHRDMLAFIQLRHSEKTATLDMDATLVETTKRDALYSYKGYKAYQPLNVWWTEQQVVSYTEFRDGGTYRRDTSNCGYCRKRWKHCRQGLKLCAYGPIRQAINMI